MHFPPFFLLQVFENMHTYRIHEAFLRGIQNTLWKMVYPRVSMMSFRRSLKQALGFRNQFGLIVHNIFVIL